MRHLYNALLIVFISFFLFGFQPLKKNELSLLVKFDNMEWVDDVGAKKFPSVKKVYKVNDYGAIGDGKTLNTKAIQDAIDDCSANGGGEIVFDPGKYLTGAIFIKSGINFIIDTNVIILGSRDIKDYPEIDTRVAGIEMRWPAALINIIDQECSAIVGKGTVFAQGKIFWDQYWDMRYNEYEPKGLRWIIDYDCKRPRTILVSNSKNIAIEDVTLLQAGFWTIHILYSEYITVDRVIIKNNIDGHGPSTDGIDIDSSEKILVQNCDIDCNDDNFCIKSGRDADGLRVNKPTRYVVIKDCIARRGGGLITLGSETSGGMSNILAMNLKATGTGSGIRLKSAKTRGGIIENIYFQDLQMDSVDFPFIVTLDWNPKYSYSKLPKEMNYDSIPKHWKVMLQKVEPAEKGIPVFRNIYVKNLNALNAREGIIADGLENSILSGFRLDSVYISSVKPGKLKYAKDWKLKNVSIQTPGKGSIIKSNIEGIIWEN